MDSNNSGPKRIVAKALDDGRTFLTEFVAEGDDKHSSTQLDSTPDDAAATVTRRSYLAGAAVAANVAGISTGLTDITSGSESGDRFSTGFGEYTS